MGFYFKMTTKKSKNYQKVEKSEALSDKDEILEEENVIISHELTELKRVNAFFPF